MKYVCTVKEIVISELIVEADSEEDARNKAEQAVYNSNAQEYVHDSATETTAYVALPEMQEGGEYYDPKEVSRW